MTDAIAWWSEVYRSNDIVQLLAALGHIASIAYAARYALAGDRAALRITSHSKRPADDLRTLTSAHSYVLTGLAFALVTGIAQLAAQLDYLQRSPVFWIKMSTLTALLVNGRLIQLAGRRAVMTAAA
ncbi:MAG: hypothetical protein ABIV28_07740 [Longimicrobiales bacterium]